MDNTCVCCGEIIPEGRMVCPNCEEGFINSVEFRKDYGLPILKKEFNEYEKIVEKNVR